MAREAQLTPGAPRTQSALDVIVIGAGMAGVTAARELHRAGLSVMVVEARDRIGGRVWSIHDFCDRPVEAGAEFIHGVGARTWPEVQAAGLTTLPSPPVHRTLFNVGGRTRWLPWIVLHPSAWPAFPMMRAIKRTNGPDRSARAFIEDRGYRGRTRTLAEMTLTAHLPGSVDEVGVLGLVEDGVLHLETSVNHRIVEGYDGLPREIGSALEVRLGFAAEEVHWARDGVAVRSGTGEEISSRAAVSTLPVGVLKSGNVRFVPQLPESKLSALDVIEMGPVLKILLHFEEAFWPPWAAVVGCGVGPVTLYWPVFQGVRDGPAVLTAYCTGPRASELSRVGEEEALDVVLRDLKRLFPRAAPQQTILSHRRIDWAADPYALGGYTFLRPGGTGARARLRSTDTGALFWAGAGTEWVPIAATVEAAYSSGLRAAGEVRAHLDLLEPAAGSPP